MQGSMSTHLSPQCGARTRSQNRCRAEANRLDSRIYEEVLSL
jgi:hypothetical protein